MKHLCYTIITNQPITTNKEKTMTNPLYNSIINITINFINDLSNLSDKELSEVESKINELVSEYNKPLDLCTEEEISKIEDIKLYIFSIGREISDRRMRAFYYNKHQLQNIEESQTT